MGIQWGIQYTSQSDDLGNLSEQVILAEESLILVLIMPYLCPRRNKLRSLVSEMIFF